MSIKSAMFKVVKNANLTPAQRQRAINKITVKLLIKDAQRKLPFAGNYDKAAPEEAWREREYTQHEERAQQTGREAPAARRQWIRSGTGGRRAQEHNEYRQMLADMSPEKADDFRQFMKTRADAARAEAGGDTKSQRYLDVMADARRRALDEWGVNTNDNLTNLQNMGYTGLGPHPEVYARGESVSPTRGMERPIQKHVRMGPPSVSLGQRPPMLEADAPTIPLLDFADQLRSRNLKQTPKLRLAPAPPSRGMERPVEQRVRLDIPSIFGSR